MTYTQDTSKPSILKFLGYILNQTIIMNKIKMTSLYLPLILTLVTFFTSPISLAQESNNASAFFEKIEAFTGGKIGVYAINLANGEQISYRANEHFPMGCTSKVVGVGAILAASMKDHKLLSEKMTYKQEDLVNWNPITEKYLDKGMTVFALCEAAISYSDNTAMNLLVKKIGGLEQINEFARALNNTSFRQDHGWPEEAYSGGVDNLQDSSTPQDMVNTLQRLTHSDSLTAPLQRQLIAWLQSNTTGNGRIRAGVPKNWVVGDKTGSGAAYGTTNDLGIIWPTNCLPIYIGIYYTNDNKASQIREDTVAAATQIVVNELAKNDKCIQAAKSE